MVVVTGVTAGIGRALAGRLLQAGMTVVGCARDPQRLEVVAAKLPGLLPVRCDVRDRLDRAQLVDGTLDRYGRIDVLVNNAGVGYVGAVVDMTADDIDRVVTTNAVALMDLTRLVLPGMLSRRDGDVLVLSSAAVWVSTPPLTVYAASKYAVDGFVEGLRRGIRIHSVNPGFVATEFLARALREHPREGDPKVLPAPGIDADRVARQVERELRGGRGRTVAVPRLLGLGRLLGVPALSHATDIGIRLASGRLERLGRSIAHTRTPAAKRERSSPLPPRV